MLCDNRAQPASTSTGEPIPTGGRADSAGYRARLRAGFAVSGAAATCRAYGMIAREAKMDREQRRKAQRPDVKRARNESPRGDASGALVAGIADGDRFTIAGVRRMDDGRIIRNCRPGNETVFTAEIARAGQ